MGRLKVMWFSGRDLNENSLDFFTAQLQKVFYSVSLKPCSRTWWSLLDLSRFLKGDRTHGTSSSVQCHSQRIKLLEYEANPLSTGAGVLWARGRVGRPVPVLTCAGDPANMGCGLRKLEDPEDSSSPGKIYSTLKRPQVETKTDSVYEYVLLDFSLEGTDQCSKQIFKWCCSLTKNLPW